METTKSLKEQSKQCRLIAKILTWMSVICALVIVSLFVKHDVIDNKKVADARLAYYETSKEAFLAYNRFFTSGEEISDEIKNYKESTDDIASIIEQRKKLDEYISLGAGNEGTSLNEAGADLSMSYAREVSALKLMYQNVYALEALKGTVSMLVRVFVCLCGVAIAAMAEKVADDLDKEEKGLSEETEVESE